jgi:hypothetical protein
MRLLAEAVREVELTKADIKFFNDVMSNGQKFREWMQRDRPDMNTLVKAFSYELDRGRVRSAIFKRIVESYNRLLTDLNWATANGLIGKKVA